MVVLPAGAYRPLLRNANDPKIVSVKSFLLDVTPVSNSEFRNFVRANPSWQRSHVNRIFADNTYLKNWAGDLELGNIAPAGAPVVSVSWFAAKAFAQWKGKRLPTTAEWEFAASASPTQADGQNNPAFQAEVLRWFAEPAATELLPVESGRQNFYGIRALHGLVWEWVSDFNSAMLTANSRANSLDSRLFCGSGARSSQDAGDYATFMRFAFRSSLQADYCVHNLGFRCAKDL